ncbi:MAG: cytochrome c biogenesis protein ResB [Planctomycetes bacterium]|nr:cytochrome c biogenesis protein ResB [Planctomycetota bacterium]
MTTTTMATPPALPKAAMAPPRSLATAVLGLVGSMELSVYLLLYLGLLTFLGTIAQLELSAYDAQKEYFESWSAPLFRGYWIRIPGGLPTMIALFCNLLIGGVIRIRWQKRTIGILITHFGMLLLLLAGWVKHAWSISGSLALFEGQQGTTFVSFHEWEVALVRQDGDKVFERMVPAEAFAAAALRGLARIDDPALPFAVDLHHWLENCEPAAKGPMVTTDMPVVDGVYLRAVDVDLLRRERNFAGCYARVTERGGATHEGVLFGWENRPEVVNDSPFTFTVAGQRYGLMLRRKTWDLPFSVRLDKFMKRDHPGTVTPMDFSSEVTVFAGDQTWPVRIFMNNPLRRDGHVLYQTSYGMARDGRMYSALEVAQNPSDKWPEYACYVIAVGLVWHFGRKLLGYVKSQQQGAHA